jgi:hypothetical protein
VASNEIADAMHKMAQGAVAFAAKGDVTLDYSPASIDRLEGYLADLYEYLCSSESTWTDQKKWSAALTFGAYVGEVVRRTHGGAWQAGESGPRHRQWKSGRPRRS